MLRYTPLSTILLSACLLAIACPLVGCTCGSTKSTYSLMPDQVFYGRGASEARLGAWGIEDDTCPNTFERMGWDKDLVEGHKSYYVRAVIPVRVKEGDSFRKSRNRPVELVPAAATCADGCSSSCESCEDSATLCLAIVDLNKDHTLLHLNLPEFVEVREQLRRTDDSRIVTAVAIVLGPECAGCERSGACEACSATIARVIEGDTGATLQPGWVYAYQMSRVGWSPDRERITVLKTDRPRDRDDFQGLGEPATRAE